MFFLLPKEPIKNTKILSKNIAKFLYDKTVKEEGIIKADQLKIASIEELENILEQKSKIFFQYYDLRSRNTLLRSLEICYEYSIISGRILGVPSEVRKLLVLDVKKELKKL